MKRVAPVLVSLSLFAAAAPAADAASNRLQISGTMLTPPAQFSSGADIRVTGAIVATSKKKTAKLCRHERQVTITNPKAYPTGAVTRMDLFQTPRSGKIKGVIGPYDYGGIPPGETEPRSGDVPYSGGELVLSVFVAPRFVPGKSLDKPFRCKPLTATMTFSIPPAPAD